MGPSTQTMHPRVSFYFPFLFLLFPYTTTLLKTMFSEFDTLFIPLLFYQVPVVQPQLEARSLAQEVHWKRPGLAC